MMTGLPLVNDPDPRASHASDPSESQLPHTGMSRWFIRVGEVRLIVWLISWANETRTVPQAGHVVATSAIQCALTSIVSVAPAFVDRRRVPL